MSLRRNIPLGISGRAGVLGSVYAWTAHGQYIKLFYAHLASPGFPVSAQPWKSANPLAFAAVAKCATTDSAMPHCASFAITAHKKAARGRRETALPQPGSVIRLHDRGSIHRDGPACCASRPCRLRPSRLAVCHDERRAAASRQARHSDDPAGSLLGSPRTQLLPADRLAQSESRPSTVWSLQNRRRKRNTGPEYGSVLY